MIPGMMGAIVGLGGFSSVVRSVTQTDTRSTAAGSHSSVDFGIESAGSWCVVFAWHGNSASDPGTTPTCTIGGVSATRYVARTTGDGGTGTATGAAIFAAQSVGASGAVAVSWAGLNTSIVVLRVTGYDLASAFHSGSESSSSDTVSINIPNNGLLLGAIGRANEALGIDWTNITERGDEVSDSNRRAWAWDINMSTETGRNVSYTPHSAVFGANVIVLASFSSL